MWWNVLYLLLINIILMFYADGDTRLMGIFQDNFGKLVPECLHFILDFIGAQDNNNNGGDNWSSDETYKAPVKLSATTN